MAKKWLPATNRRQTKAAAISIGVAAVYAKNRVRI